MASRTASGLNTAVSEADDYWSSLTDDDLDSVTWFTADPKGLANIQPVAPADIGKFIIEVEYKLEQGVDQPVRCAHCPTHTPHWHGFVLRTDDGRRILLGSVCGPKAYGADYRAASSARNEKYKRWQAIQRWLRAQEHLPDNIAALAAIERSIAFRSVATARGRFDGMAPQTLALLRSGLRPNTLTEQVALSVTKTVRDFDEEKSRQQQWDKLVEELAGVALKNQEHRRLLDEARARIRPGVPVERTVVVELGLLQGWRWLFGPNPAQRVRDILQRLRGLHALGQATQDKPRARIEQSARMVETEVPEAAEALRAIREAGAFFDAANLGRLAAWAEGQPRRPDIQAVGSKLIVRDPLANPIELSLPPRWAPPDHDVLV